MEPIMLNHIISAPWPKGWQSKLDQCLLLVIRLVIGGFLVWGVLDNILSHDRMQEFVAFLTQFKFVYPEVMAPLSVWVQFCIGLALIVGLFTRIAGGLCVINFTVAIVMVDSHGGIRASFPSVCLILFALVFIVRGAGHWSLDKLVSKV